MPRDLTELEWNDLSKQFPQLQRENVTVINDNVIIENYNCTAWSLDYTDQWFTVPSGLRAIKDGYKDIGGVLVKTLSDDAGIDCWGQDRASIDHASRFLDGRWTSKIGPGLCITHGRNELRGKYPAYGEILASFLPIKRLKEEESIAGLADFLSWKEETKMLPAKLASENITDNEKQKFEEAFGCWKSTWFEGDMAFNSNTLSRAKGEAFNQLVSMEKRISIPLVIEKLADPDNFIALVLHEKVENRPHLLAPIGHGSLKSEQIRSQRVVKLWLDQ